jgi:anhydro-N-acetylmuramic acid kinase
VVCGGGRHNPLIMEMLASRAGVEAVPAEAVGWRGDAIEAECFAFLAARVIRGLPISFPTTTGAPYPLTGGRVAG